MPSQLESLKKGLAEVLKANGGKETPFVKGLRAQIAMLEKPPAENPVDNQVRLSMGMRGPEAK